MSLHSRVCFVGALVIAACAPREWYPLLVMCFLAFVAYIHHDDDRTP